MLICKTIAWIEWLSFMASNTRLITLMIGSMMADTTSRTMALTTRHTLSLLLETDSTTIDMAEELPTWSAKVRTTWKRWETRIADTKLDFLNFKIKIDLHKTISLIGEETSRMVFYHLWLLGNPLEVYLHLLATVTSSITLATGQLRSSPWTRICLTMEYRVKR